MNYIMVPPFSEYYWLFIDHMTLKEEDDWLIDWSHMIDWLIDWLMGVANLEGRGWLIDRLVPYDWLIDRLIDGCG